MIGAKDKLKKIFKKNNRLSKPGFTLVEVLISTALFSVIVLSVTSLFKLSIDAQRRAIAAQNVQESLKYFFEVMSKEIRMAQTDEGVCPNVPDDQIFYYVESSFGDTLYFKNYYGECITYYRQTDGNGIFRFGIARRPSVGPVLFGFISPAKINISRLDFFLKNNEPGQQPIVTVRIEANSVGYDEADSIMALQTSVSSRYYK